MKVASDDAVVFRRGVHEYRCEHGTVTVHVPRDVTLGDIRPALTELVRGRMRHEAEKGCAPESLAAGAR